MNAAITPVWTTVDFEKNGKQIGHINVPHSIHGSGYGQIMIPVCVVKNGSGPTALLMAGNHGDEFEGPVVLGRLLRKIDPEAVQGRIIIIPAINVPAVDAATRTSPLDSGNLNRSFPGSTDKGPTSMMAHYLYHHIFPMVDVMHDFHAGGLSMHYLQHATIALSGDPDHDTKAVAAVKAFAPPVAKLMRPRVFWNSSHPAATSRGVIALGGEFGGAGEVSLEGAKLIHDGLHRLLAHFGIIELPAGIPASKTTKVIEVGGHEYYVFASEDGVFAPVASMGDMVKSGDVAGLVHDFHKPTAEPEPQRFRCDGWVVCQRALGRCRRGDCLYHVASETNFPET